MTHAKRPGDGPVPHSLLDSQAMDRAEAIALWKDSLSAIYDVRLLSPETAAFASRAEAYHLGDVVLTSYRCSAQTFDRPRSRIGRDGIDHFTLQFCLSGRHGPRDGAASEVAGPGDLLIADLAQPHATGTSDFDSLNLTVPRRLLAPLLNDADHQNLRVISADAPLNTLLRQHVRGLFEAAPAMARREAEAVVGPTLALAAAVLNARDADSGAESLDPILATQVRRFLSSQATDPALTAQAAAARFGISRRKLYHLMEPHGGVAAYVREQRLLRARAMLRDPAHRGLGVGEVAQSCGFAWRTNFARTFRLRFGMTPLEARMLASRFAPPPPGAAKDRHMWDWIRAMR